MPTTMRVSSLAMRLSIRVALVALLLAPPAAAMTPQQIVAFINHQRVSNGIPGGITLEPAWTLGCQHHIRYEETNGIAWTHQEVKGKPGYTKDGALAGAMGDQAYTHGFAEGNPYENLPTHLINLLQPTLQKIGAYESGNRSCLEVSPGYTRQIKTNQVYVYPGPGRTGVPTSQLVHNEFPMSPGDTVGLPQGTTHGPTIYVMAAGPWVYGELPLHITSAHLRTASGPVAIRIVDPTQHPKLRPYVAPGAFFLIPVSPLAPNTTFYATAVIRGKSGTTLTKRWQFRTD